MNKIITLCLLIICVIVTGCGNAAGSGSLNNTPVIYNVTPNDSSSIASSVDSNGNLAVTLTGVNFGTQNQGRVYYNGYTSETSTTPQSIPLTLYYGGSWTDNSISVNLVKTTRETYPNGSFYVVANGQQSPVTARYNFGVGNLTNAIVSSINPSVFNSYDNSSNRYMTITGSGFGTVKKNLVLFSMTSSSSVSKEVEPISWTDTSISFIIPDNLVDSSATIGIKVADTGAMLGNSYTSSFKYNVFNPTISNVSPTYAYPGQTVTIYSYNGGFGTERPGNMYLSINDITVLNVTSWNDSSITFVIPENTSFAAGQATIKLYLNNKTITNSSLALVPHITNVTVYKDSAGILGLGTTYKYTMTGYCLSPNTSMFIDNTLSSDISMASSSTSTIVFTSSKDLAGRNVYLTTGNSSITSNYYSLPSASN